MYSFCCCILSLAAAAAAAEFLFSNVFFFRLLCFICIHVEKNSAQGRHRHRHREREEKITSTTMALRQSGSNFSHQSNRLMFSTSSSSSLSSFGRFYFWYPLPGAPFSLFDFFSLRFFFYRVSVKHRIYINISIESNHHNNERQEIGFLFLIA